MGTNILQKPVVSIFRVHSTHISVDHNLCSHCHENLKSHKKRITFECTLNCETKLSCCVIINSDLTKTFGKKGHIALQNFIQLLATDVNFKLKFCVLLWYVMYVLS